MDDQLARLFGHLRDTFGVHPRHPQVDHFKRLLTAPGQCVGELGHKTTAKVVEGHTTRRGAPGAYKLVHTRS